MPVDLFHAAKPFPFELGIIMADLVLSFLSLAIVAFFALLIALTVKAAVITIVHLFSNSGDSAKNVYTSWRN